MSAARSTSFGYPVVWDDTRKANVYADDGMPIDGNPRPCKACGELETTLGHDPCIASLPGVRAACCGHGVPSEAYVMFMDNRVTLRGSEAVLWLEAVKENRRAVRDLRVSLNTDGTMDEFSMTDCALLHVEDMGSGFWIGVYPRGGGDRYALFIGSKSGRAEVVCNIVEQPLSPEGSDHD
jgi:hypothetical protein